MGVRWLGGLTGLCFFLSLITVVWADPFITYPGTKARAMGSAFVAVADDASAVWYNPAGIRSGRANLTVEFSTVPDISTSGTGDNIKFDSIDDEWSGFIALSGSHDRLGWGLSWGIPYHVKWWVDTGSIHGSLDEWMHVYSAALSYGIIERNSIWFSELRLGGTLEGVLVNAEDSDLFHVKYYSRYYEFTKLDSGDLSDFGVSGSLGVWGTLLKTIDSETSAPNWEIDYGLVYRFPDTIGEMDEVSYEKEQFSEDVAFTKPPSWDIGLAVSKYFLGLYKVQLTGQYSKVLYSEAVDYFNFDYERYSVGAELQYNGVGLIKFVSLRGGYYHSEVSDEEFKTWPDVDGYTFGMGLGISEHVTLEGAVEIRDYSGVTFSNYDESSDKPDDITLWTISFRYSF